MSDTPNDLEVTFWGTRGSLPTPGRATEKYGGNTPCVSIKSADSFIIIDAGTGIRSLGNDIISGQVNPGNEIHLLLSHTHWDHIQGLPFFLPAYMKGSVFKIYGNPNKGGFLADILRGQMDYDYFPVDMSQLGSQPEVIEMPETELMFGNLCMKWQEQYYHPGGCMRFSFEINGKKVVYASDVEINKMFDVTEPSDEEKQNAVDYLQFIRGADLLIADGQYTQEEYNSKVDWGHTSMELLFDVAYKAGVKKLAVFHHDPDHPDELLDMIWSQTNPYYLKLSPAMQVFWAREGMTVPI